MIEAVIDFSARHKYVVILLALAAVLGAVACVRNIPLDAIPDLSDTQVIVYSRWDRSPDIIEDQVTYPVISALLGSPRVKAIRGFSDFGFSYVYVIFQDGTDLYWARSRVAESLGKIAARLPAGVATEIGPDATSVGWVYQYALIDRSGRNDLASLRGFQDWSLRYWLQSVPGVAEVASVGGFQKQYQVSVDPNALAAYKIPLDRVVERIRAGNNDTGGRLVEFAGTEYMVRGRGYAKSVQDIENIAVGADASGAPVLVRNVARVALGPELRRGLADLDGEGEAVGGIVLMRQGENALNVIGRVKEKIESVRPSLPAGVELVTTYDRSDLIRRAIGTLRSQLVEEMLIVSLVILLFLWHIPSAVVPIVTIPVAVLLSFIPLYGLKITTNIMSLSGIAISIGVLVDGAIVEVENAYKKLQLWEAGGRRGDYHAVRLSALKEVGPSVFFSLLVIAVAFLPIFTLVDQEGRLFKPLAYSKNLALAIAALLAVTLDPAMRMLFTRMEGGRFRPLWLSGLVNTLTVGRYYPEEKHPVSRVLFRVYEPVCRFVLRHRGATLVAAALLVLSALPVYGRLGSEFMPPLNEGAILYMPTTFPGISASEIRKVLQNMDRILRATPEVASVFGKAGRADTSTDPAPLSMLETTLILKPEDQWRKVPRWYSGLPEFAQIPLRHVWRDRIRWEDLVAELDAAMRFPGMTNAWTMPIKARIDMLSTGIRTPVGVKIYGPDLQRIQDLGVSLESILKGVRGTRSVFAERVTGGYFIDFDLKREQLARYGLSVDDAERVIASAIGGETVTTTVEGRERYGVSVRYAREFRDDLDALKRVQVAAGPRAQVPLEELADIRITAGPAMIRDENGMLAGYVYVDIAGRDVGSYVEEARRVAREKLPVPAGYYLQWSGQFENMLRVRERLKIVIPVTLFLIFLLLYLNTRSPAKAGIVMLAVPFSMVGAVWLLYALGYNMSIAVWVGMIALMGLDAETGVFMLLFLDLAYADRVRQGRMRTRQDLEEAVVQGAVKRIRPKLMTVTAMFLGLIPILWSMGTGADMMKRVAAPMVGGVFTSFIMELLVYPPVYALWKWHGEMKLGRAKDSAA